jgi:SAM-dependent methyltransferase
LPTQGQGLGLAHFHPAMKVLCIDISKDMIDYAQEQAKVQKQKNTLFYVMDAMQPLLFPIVPLISSFSHYCCCMRSWISLTFSFANINFIEWSLT